MPRTTHLLSPSRFALASIAFGLLTISGPAIAQKTVEGRVDRLEKEMQAVQRKVFPGGAGQIVAPDVAPEVAPAQQAGSPASTPLTDLTARVNAIEAQLARLTGTVEEDGHRLRQLEQANIQLRAQIVDMQKLITAANQPAEALAAPASATAPQPASAGRGGSSPTPAPTPTATPAASPARTQAVAAIERPSTGSDAQDNYVYGYRLWNAKFFPEAQVQLEDTVKKFASDPVRSRAGNLLGRAYLDDGKPTLAARTFIENYRAQPAGDRAAESLAWAGEALIQLNKPKDACIAYEELGEVFGANMPDNVRDMMTKGRSRARCGG